MVEAIARQAALLNTNTRYLHRTILDYAERLAATFPDPLRVVYFTNSGSEANELALRLARTVTGRHDVVAVDWGYHGNTNDLVEISAYKFNRKGGAGKPPHTHLAELPDPYRGASRRRRAAYAGVGRRGRRSSASPATDTAPPRSSPRASAAAAVRWCSPPDYLAAAVRSTPATPARCTSPTRCRWASGAWAVACGRSSTQGVVPDIVTLGKPIGNGHPLGAVVTTPEIAAAFANGMEWFNTFGGNPVSCAAGMAVLDVIDGEGLQAHAPRRRRSPAAAASRALADDTRPSATCAARASTSASIWSSTAPPRSPPPRWPPRSRIVCASAACSSPPTVRSTTCIKIKPPLVFALAEADLLCDELDRALSS